MHEDSLREPVFAAKSRSLRNKYSWTSDSAGRSRCDRWCRSSTLTPFVYARSSRQDDIASSFNSYGYRPTVVTHLIQANGTQTIAVGLTRSER